MEPDQAREYLTLDLYLRENAKSRPVWATDLSSHKEEVRAFYRQEAAEHRYLANLAGRDAKSMYGMTHMELFEAIFEEPAWLLFDYSERNPVTDDARTLRINSLPSISE